MSAVVTFYSFKGGVGRTMALANIAVLLAQRGKRVLAVDWDLEAPGLHQYFAERSDGQKSGGLLELLHQGLRHPGEPPQWHEHISRIELPARGKLDLLPAGAFDNQYAQRLEDFGWHNFFADRNGGQFIEHLRNDWRKQYDFTLIDSRTGYTDSGGVCTILLPDLLVAVFTANEQSLSGVETAIAKAQAGRQELDVDRPPLLVVPLPSRFDGRVEVEEAERWTNAFATRLAPYYDGWLPRGTSYRRVVEQTRVPHVPFFTFGEKLAVVGKSLTDPEGMGHVYDMVAALLEDELANAEVVLFGRRFDASAAVADDLTPLTMELERRIESRIERVRRATFRARSWTASAGLLLAATGVATLLEGTGSAWRDVLGVVVLALGALGAAASAVFPVRILRSLAARDTTELEVSLESLRLARAVDRERPGQLLEAYEAASNELKEIEHEMPAASRRP
jgi:cellulose biosynthesis protein BcsQ